MVEPVCRSRRLCPAEVVRVCCVDLVWLADQNVLRGQFRLGRVMEACSDAKCVVCDVRVRTCQRHPVFIGQSKRNLGVRDCPSTILHRDVRRLGLLLPREEQEKISPPWCVSVKDQNLTTTILFGGWWCVSVKYVTLMLKGTVCYL